MFKKKTGLLGSSFQKRWFRIEGDKLVYYKDRDDLEHLGWIDLSEARVVRNPPEEPDPFVFVLELPGRKYVLKASKKEHFNAWVDTLDKWTGKFQAEKAVSTFVPAASFSRMASSASLAPPEESGGGREAGQDDSSRASGVPDDDDDVRGNDIRLSSAEGEPRMFFLKCFVLKKMRFLKFLLKSTPSPWPKYSKCWRE